MGHEIEFGSKTPPEISMPIGQLYLQYSGIINTTLTALLNHLAKNDPGELFHYSSLEYLNPNICNFINTYFAFEQFLEISETPLKLPLIIIPFY